MGRRTHFVSQALSRSHNSSALSKGERGMGRLSHILFLRRPLSGQGQSDTLEKCIISLKEREGWDRSVTFSSLTFSLNTRAFPSLSRRERDGTAQSHSVPSPPFGLRPEAVILDRAVFASLSRGQSNPLRGFSSTSFSLETKSEALRLRFSFQRRERDSTLGPVTDSGFRDRPIRPLWHLSEVCII